MDTVKRNDSIEMQIFQCKKIITVFKNAGKAAPSKVVEALKALEAMQKAKNK